MTFREEAEAALEREHDRQLALCAPNERAELREEQRFERARCSEIEALGSDALHAIELLIAERVHDALRRRDR